MRYAKISTKLTAHHPLVKFINAEREAGRYAELTADGTGGLFHIVNTRQFDRPIIDGTPSFHTKNEALDFIHRARNLAFKARHLAFKARH